MKGTTCLIGLLLLQGALVSLGFTTNGLELLKKFKKDFKDMSARYSGETPKNDWYPMNFCDDFEDLVISEIEEGDLNLALDVYSIILGVDNQDKHAPLDADARIAVCDRIDQFAEIYDTEIDQFLAKGPDAPRVYDQIWCPMTTQMAKVRDLYCSSY